MHMSDALVSPAVGLGAGVAAAGLIALAARHAGAEPQHARRIPLMGVLAAFVFAAQMINFSIPGTGSSGHLGGGLLLAILLGPAAALLAMASVLTVQCLLFADGGLLALGCNILNLGLWPCLVGLPLYHALAGNSASPRRATVAALLAAAVSLQLGALGVVVETVLSGRSELPFAPFGGAMLGIHLPIGLVEGLVTAGVLRVLQRTGGHTAVPASASAAPSLLGGLAVAALLTSGGLAWFASSRPDGLEWAMARVTGQEALAVPGTGMHARAAATQDSTALLPDYAVPAAPPRLGVSLAGVGGALVVGVVVSALGFAATGTRRRGAPVG